LARTWFSLGAPIHTSACGLPCSASRRARAGPADKNTKRTLMPVAFVNSFKMARAFSSSTLEYTVSVWADAAPTVMRTPVKAMTTAKDSVSNTLLDFILNKAPLQNATKHNETTTYRQNSDAKRACCPVARVGCA